ncbi:MAG: AAA family ATPase [Promethearchaeota archaeon]
MYQFDKYKGSEDYIASQELRNIVNVSVAIERPLLVKGEPGTGKTLLAKSIADSLGMRLIIWNVKSTTKAVDGCYTYDTIQRLNDSRFGSETRDIENVEDYIRLGQLGESFDSKDQVVLLIDEIDKADIEFPNDLLQELDIMEFYIPELHKTVKTKHRPVVIITSNNEKELPDAFLRRCIFHFINFPEEELMDEIVRVHYPNIKKNILDAALERFYSLRVFNQLKKKPSTSELIDWIGVLLKAGITEKDLKESFPFLGTLIKKEQDIEYLSKYKGIT